MNPSQLTSRERLQQAIDAEIKSLEESARALKRRRNALSPISSLPPELFTTIFSLLCLLGTPSLVCGNLKPDHHLARLRVSHVCHRWREIALHQPLLWSRVDFTKAGASEILVRAKSVPLYLEANISHFPWDEVRFTTFRNELQTRTPYICHLSISAGLEHLHKTVKELVAPAPTLEYLSLFSHGKSLNETTGSHLFVPDTLFNGSTPRLSRLKLYNCEINGKSQLLRGLRYLEIRSLPADARPNPAAWVDTLDEMPHLTTLALHTASPIAPPFPFDVKRTATLPSLTHLEILDSPRDCALALAHLNLPALAILYITATCRHRINSNDVQILLSYVVRHAHGPQDSQPLQSVLVRNEGSYADILAWPVPDIDVEVQDPPTLLAATLPARVTLSLDWHVPAACIGMVIATLPLNSVVTFVAQDFTNVPDNEFWLCHLLEWPLLRRVRLAAPVEYAFRGMLFDREWCDSPLLPSFRELALVDGMSHDDGWKDVLTARVEQGVQLELLDLRMHAPIPQYSALFEVLSKLAVNVLSPEKTSEERERIRSIWKTLGSGLFVDVDFEAGDSDHSSTDDDSDNDQW
jgi:hypothetical protein